MEDGKKIIKNQDDLGYENNENKDTNDQKISKHNMTDLENGLNLGKGKYNNDLDSRIKKEAKNVIDFENEEKNQHEFEKVPKKEYDLKNVEKLENDLENGSSNEDRKSSDISLSDKPFIGLRWIIVWMIFSSYITLFFLRNSIGVIVVAIVNTTSDDENDYSKDACPAAINQSEPANSEVKGPLYNWGTNEQGFILGAYFWGYVISRLFLTRLSEKFGQRETMCLSMVVAGLVALISPWTASISGYLFAVTRLITGVCFGPSSGVVSGLLSAWAPKNELSLMASVSFSGATVGGTIGFFLSGWLSEALGWTSVFYIGGAITILVAPSWMIVARNNPFDHPWLSNYEREILKDKKQVRTKKNAPWLKIMFSPYVLIIIYGTFARSWLDQILNNEGPSYFGYKIGLDVDTSSYIVGVSSISSIVFMLVCGKASDYITNKKYLSRINTRKFFHAIGSAVPVIILLGLTWTGCDSTAAIIWWMALAGATVATISSFTLSIIDIAPNHTGTVNALLAVGSLGSAIAPSIISALIATDNGWNKSFYLIAGINVISLIIYVLFMTDQPQPWNFDKEKKENPADTLNFDNEQKENPTDATNSVEVPKENPTDAINSAEVQKENPTDAINSVEVPKENPTDAINSVEIQKENPADKMNFSKEQKQNSIDRKNFEKNQHEDPADAINNDTEQKNNPIDTTNFDQEQM